MMVSVVIPVYNMSQYIGQCIGSVCGQTYKNLEIIIVYDKSEDDSLAHCLEWEKNDGRIRLIINEKRGGLGAARNTGLLQAAGEYIFFLDSDDWLDKQCVETLYEKMLQSKADFVACSSFYRAGGTHRDLEHGVPEGLYQKDEAKRILLCGNYVSTWGKLYRREWLLKNKLMTPEIFHYEDWGLYLLMASCAEKVYVSAKPCVYYRQNWEGCLSLDDEALLIQDFEKSMAHMFGYLDIREKKDPVSGLQAYYCWRDFYMRYFINLKSGNDMARSVLDHIKSDILIPRFGNLEPKMPDYIALGSFALRWELQRGCIANPKVDRHFCFSSLISIFSDVPEMDVMHENPFRQAQLRQEMESALLHTIIDADEKTLLFLDFLEERFDVMELRPGAYVTESDAFRESNLNGLDYVRRIKSGSREHMALWQRSCDKLVDILKEHIRPEQIFLVKNRMSCTYGNFERKQAYENAQEINRTNQMLEEMEAYFIERMRGLMAIDIDKEYMFTDDMFKWGCRPEYANNAQYLDVGWKISKKCYGI